VFAFNFISPSPPRPIQHATPPYYAPLSGAQRNAEGVGQGDVERGRGRKKPEARKTARGKTIKSLVT